MYLRQIGQNYYIHCLGNNGEPLKNQKINITARHKDFNDPVKKAITLDKMGRVKLGPLDGIERIEANVERHDNSISESWLISNE